MKRQELLFLGEMIVWIGATLIRAAGEGTLLKAAGAPHAVSPDSLANEFKRRFPSNREDAA